MTALNLIRCSNLMWLIVQVVRREMLSHVILIDFYNFLIFVSAGYCMWIDLSTMSYKYFIGPILDIRDGHTKQKYLNCSSNQFWATYFVGIFHHCWSTWTTWMGTNHHEAVQWSCHQSMTFLASSSDSSPCHMSTLHTIMKHGSAPLHHGLIVLNFACTEENGNLPHQLSISCCAVGDIFLL